MIGKEEMEKLVFDSQKVLGSGLEVIVCTQEDASLKSPGVPAHYYRYLYFLADKIKPKLSVELGTHTGISAACIAEGYSEGKVITIDNHNYLREECKRRNIEYWIQDSLATLKRPIDDINLLFIDTAHDGVRAKNEYNYWLKYMADDGIVLFDDINLNDEMKQFWASFNPTEGLKFELLVHGWAGFGVILLGEGGDKNDK